jgi:hypothetical protein
VSRELVGPGRRQSSSTRRPPYRNILPQHRASICSTSKTFAESMYTKSKTTLASCSFGRTVEDDSRKKRVQPKNSAASIFLRPTMCHSVWFGSIETQRDPRSPHRVTGCKRGYSIGEPHLQTAPSADPPKK